jgi:hypothetical protein
MHPASVNKGPIDLDKKKFCRPPQLHPTDTKAWHYWRQLLRTLAFATSQHWRKGSSARCSIWERLWICHVEVHAMRWIRFMPKLCILFPIWRPWWAYTSPFFPLNVDTSGYPGGSEDCISELLIGPIRKPYVFCSTAGVPSEWNPFLYKISPEKHLSFCFE